MGGNRLALVFKDGGGISGRGGADDPALRRGALYLGILGQDNNTDSTNNNTNQPAGLARLKQRNTRHGQRQRQRSAAAVGGRRGAAGPGGDVSVRAAPDSRLLLLTGQSVDSIPIEDPSTGEIFAQ